MDEESTQPEIRLWAMDTARFVGWKIQGQHESDFDAEFANCKQVLEIELRRKPHLRDAAAKLVRRGFHDPLLILYILGLRKRPGEGQKHGR